MRNILGHSPRHLRAEIAEHLRLIFRAENKTTARKLANNLLETFASKAERAMNCLESGLEDALSILTFPKHYHKRLRTTNLAERMNEEIRRRQRVIRVFPNNTSALRLIGALLAEKYDEWQQACRYFDMTDYWDFKKEQEQQEKENANNVTQITKINL